eukprot:m.88445 g.88445  ORF g.88445 m.88445 type:complete len:528 (-) comp15186_c0_seq1:277-1860(-)
MDLVGASLADPFDASPDFLFGDLIPKSDLKPLTPPFSPHDGKIDLAASQALLDITPGILDTFSADILPLDAAAVDSALAGCAPTSDGPLGVWPADPLAWPAVTSNPASASAPASATAVTATATSATATPTQTPLQQAMAGGKRAATLDPQPFLQQQPHSQQQQPMAFYSAQVPPPPPSPGGSESASASGGDSAVDELTAKKQRRMAKNRESASLSRKRKKEQFDCLERRVQELSNENQLLHQRLRQLEEENTHLRVQCGYPAAAAAATAATANNPQQVSAAKRFAAPVTALLMLGICFAFVGGPASLFGGPHSLGSPSTLLSQSPVVRAVPAVSPLSAQQHLSHGRALKALEMDGSSSSSSRAVRAHHQPQLPPRLPNAARLGRTSRQNEESEDDGSISSSSSSASSSSSSSSPQKSITDMVPFYPSEDSLDVPPVYRWHPDTSNMLIRQLSRKMDTTYAFCSEVQIVTPPHSASQPKRMSFVMPAPFSTSRVPNNATVMTSEVFQMDCRVVDSRLVVQNASLVNEA